MRRPERLQLLWVELEHHGFSALWEAFLVMYCLPAGALFSCGLIPFAVLLTYFLRRSKGPDACLWPALTVSAVQCRDLVGPQRWPMVGLIA